ncbi:MAG: DUF4864 domain-containing protein [Pseudomonadota bacterium]
MQTRRRILAAGAAALLAPALAPLAARAQSDEIEGVIASQIEAFRADDFERAFDFASPNIRRMFGSSDNFGRMVRQGYPMVWRPRSYRFSGLEAERGQLRQTVVIEDLEGAVYVADYYMIETDGGWRINGVSLRPQVGAGA